MMLFIRSAFSFSALLSSFSKDYYVLLLFEDIRPPILLTSFPEEEFFFLSLLIFCKKLLLEPIAVRSVTKGFYDESDPRCLMPCSLIIIWLRLWMFYSVS